MIFSWIRRPQILIVGGSGFIGTHLRQELDLCGMKYENIDLKDGKDFLTEPIKHYKTIIFLAWNMGQTIEAYEYNLDLLNRLSQYEHSHVVFASSAAVYGKTNTPAIETDPLLPINIYGESKVTGERYVDWFDSKTILRFSNVYGEGGHGVIDLFRSGSRVIYGSGLQVRDFVSVEFIVDAIYQIIKQPKKYQGIYNLSSGVGMTVKKTFKMYGSGKAIHKKKRPDEVHYSVLNNDKFFGRFYE